MNTLMLRILFFGLIVNNFLLFFDRYNYAIRIDVLTDKRDGIPYAELVVPDKIAVVIHNALAANCYISVDTFRYLSLIHI